MERENNQNQTNNQIEETIVANVLDSQDFIQRANPQLLFNNIASSFINKYPTYYDVINSFEDSIDHIEAIVSKESTLNDYIHTNVENNLVRVKFFVTNVRAYGPDTLEFKQRAPVFARAVTPNEALALRKTYSMLLIGDVNFEYTVISVNDTFETFTRKFSIPNIWNVSLPMPVGCKWCSLRRIDPDLLNRNKRTHVDLIKTGEDMEGLYGFFIIGGFLKYLIPYLQKPFNMPIILHNEYDNQLSRSECLYSSGLDYENSYYVIASMLKPKTSNTGRGKQVSSTVDFIFSLQMNDSTMNGEHIVGRRKALINSVPIRYLFYALGCDNDFDMLKYISPDLNDIGLIHTIRQACLSGQEHISAIKGLINYDINDGNISIPNLNEENALFIVGNIILSNEYKQAERDKYGVTNAFIKSSQKRHDHNPDGFVVDTTDTQQTMNYIKYRHSIINQTKLLLRTKFMPGVGKSNFSEKLYEIDPADLTEGQRQQIQHQEKIRNRALCYEIGSIVRELYEIGNDITPSMDKISLLNKRVRSAHQIEHEFKSFNSARMREIKISIEDYIKSFKSRKYLVDEETIENLSKRIETLSKQISMQQSLSILNSYKGVVTKEKSKMRTNLLVPKNQTFCDAMLREIVISTDQKAESTGVQWEHRVVHPSHLFFIDPIYSPEAGPQVGRYQQMTLYTYLTVGSSPKKIINFIRQNKNVMELTDTYSDKYVIKVNGSIVGYIPEYEPLEELYVSLLEARATGEIVKDCSVIVNHVKGLLEIWCDEGRIITTFVNAKKSFEIVNEVDKKTNEEIAYIQPRKEFIEWINKKDKYGNIDIDYGIKQQFITLVCPTMAAHNCTIAETINEYYKKPWMYSHVALPLHTLSYVTCVNPSMHLNAGVRASYASNHLKQAIGPTSRYSQLKYFNENNVLLAPEIPLVRTCTYDMIRLNEKPTGQNVTIAFLVYTDNQEDSFIINKSSVESGLLVIDSITAESSECAKQEEHFQIPKLDGYLNGIADSYLKLNPETCLPNAVGQKFYENEALIAKVMKMDKKNNDLSDRTIINNKPDGWREINNPNLNGDKYHYLTSEMATRELRCCTVDGLVGSNQKLKIGCFARRKIGIAGDKFNSMNAQKGTIGRIYDSTMMPYTADGLRPDIIFNPPSIFKRKTIGQIYEPTIGKLAALLGCPIESTPYSAMRTTEELDELFKQLGLNEYGYEDMYDPDTGKLIGKAFVGVMYYQRQQHLVENKLNVRAGDGDIDRVTQIPIKGKRRGGGQAYDVMSCKCAFASGVTNVFQDIHVNQGAKTTVAFCRWCNKQFTYYDQRKKQWVCSCCGPTQDFCIKEVIPAENLINNVLCGMHVCFEYQD